MLVTSNQKKSSEFTTNIHPTGCLTKESKSEKLADIYEMYQSGAVGFYDFKNPVNNPNLMKIALQYVQSFDGLVFSFPFEKSVCLEVKCMKVRLALTTVLRVFHILIRGNHAKKRFKTT